MNIHLARLLLVSGLMLSLSGMHAATVSWIQTGASSATSTAAPDSNMDWLTGSNWSGGSVPGVSDAILFDNVTADTSALSSVNGRYVVLRNSDFLGTDANSLTLNETSTFANSVEIRQDSGGPANLNARFGAVVISSHSTLAYTGQQTTAIGDPVWTRQITLGYGGTSVENAGTLTFSYGGNGNNRYVYGFLSLAEDGSFANSGSFTLNANSSNSSVQGDTRVNAAIGATTNTGTMVVNRSGDNTGGAALYDDARGGLAFASLANAGAGSSFTFNINNATLLATGIPSPAIADPAANLVVTGSFQNGGTFTVNRTPLPSGSGASGSSTDAVSRTASVQFGSFENSSTGAFVVNHNNNATPLTTTYSDVEMTAVGTAANAGWISLKGTAVSNTNGAILTRFNSQNGFSNGEGGIITVTGMAVLANTGGFSNANTQASRSIQGSVRSWDTRGLRLESTTAANASLSWATGVSLDPSTLSASSFSAENFTLGSLVLSTGTAAYSLAGGGDLLVLGDFQLNGRLNLGNWLSVTAEGGKAQTLFFAGLGLQNYVDGLIANGSLAATLPDGYSLATFASQGNDAFYVGAVVPEPRTAFLCLAGIALMLWRMANSQAVPGRPPKPLGKCFIRT